VFNEKLVSERLTLRDFDDVQETFLAREWSDGLPIVPPTELKVRELIAGTGRPASEVLGVVPPRFAEATVENVAVNAVMAGCRPEYMPVLAAAVQAACDPAFRLYSVQATTHPCGVLVLVSGPIAQSLGINSGFGVFGPGYRANATIGRALRLVLLNVGGALPGKGDQSTQGTPAKYTYCIAENEAASPWPPLRTELGFGQADSTVTVIAGEAPHNVNDHVCTSGENILHTVASVMTTLGHNNASCIGTGDVAVVFGPEHAAQVAEDGFSRAQVREFLFRHARNRVRDMRDRGMWRMHEMPDWIDLDDDDAEVPIVGAPEEILVLVAGGAGKHSAFIPTFGLSKSVTRRIEAT
jgi:hypothetical protein